MTLSLGFQSIGYTILFVYYIIDYGDFQEGGLIGNGCQKVTFIPHFSLTA